MPKTASFLLLLLLLQILSAGIPAPAAPPGKSLVVVAPRRFRAALGDYLRHKSRQLRVEAADLEQILADSPGVDDPEKLKRFLYEAWRQRGAGYALLVGDADVLPVRYMVLDRITPAAFDYAFYPSDLYYSDLARPDGSFDDWNAQKDSFHAGYFGEVRGEKNKQDPINFDGIDYLPDLAVGRWPVSTEEEVRTVAAKTIACEQAILAGQKPGQRRAALLAVAGWVDSRGWMDRIAASLPAGWTAEKRYYADSMRDDRTPPPGEEEALRLMNDGTGLIFHAGHGEDHRWDQSLGVRSLGKLKNADRLPVIISAGCSTAMFAALPPYGPYRDVAGKEHQGTDHKEEFTAPPPPPAPYQKGAFNRTGLGEALLRRSPNGAVAYIGCNTGSQPCALRLLEGFAAALGRSPAPRLGDLWSAAIAHYHEKEKLANIQPTRSWYPASIYFQGMKFMLFGDPSLILPAPAPD